MAYKQTEIFVVHPQQYQEIDSICEYMEKTKYYTRIHRELRDLLRDIQKQTLTSVIEATKGENNA